MMPVNANIWRNLITKMFILEVFGSVSISLKNKQRRKLRGCGKLRIGFCSDFI